MVEGPSWLRAEYGLNPYSAKVAASWRHCGPAVAVPPVLAVPQVVALPQVVAAPQVLAAPETAGPTPQKSRSA